MNSPPNAERSPDDEGGPNPVVTSTNRRPNGTSTDRDFALREAHAKTEAMATVVAADVLDHGDVDGTTAMWLLAMTDQVGRWIEIARHAA